MQRPVMNPSVFEDEAVSAPKPWWKRLGLGRLFRMIGLVLFYKPLSRRRLRVEDGLSPVSRFVHGLSYRLAFVPIFIALLVAAMVYAGTHPILTESNLDPTSQGLYYDTITLISDDGVRLEAWQVPLVDASAVLSRREESLRHKQSAVVLVHDFANRRQQMLPLTRPPHQAGFVVMAIGLRS